MSVAARESSLRAIQRALAACIADGAGEVIDPVEATVRREVVESYWAKLQECHYDLISDVNDPEELEKHELYIMRAEQSFMQTKTRLRRLADVRPVPAAPVAEARAHADLLPERCKIEPFYGEFAKWQEFRDMFRSLVHARPISNVQKLQMLKSAVKGSAAGVLGNWQLSGDNYEPAWQSLVDVYEDQYLIVKAHLEKLFALPGVNDAYDDLRTAIDTTNEAVRSLQVLGVPVQHWDTIIVYMLETRMSRNLKEAWDLSRPAAGLPTLRDMLVFLSARARAKANITVSFQNTSRGKTAAASAEPDRPAKARREENCPLCRESHNLYRCTDFLALSLRSREEKVQAWRLCGNCLRAGHRTSECKNGRCRTCKQPHNSVLCPARQSQQPLVASVVTVPTASAVVTSDDE